MNTLTSERTFIDTTTRYRVSPSNESWSTSDLAKVMELSGVADVIVGTGPNLALLYMENENPETTCITYDAASSLLAQVVLTQFYDEFRRMEICNPGELISTDIEYYRKSPEFHSLSQNVLQFIESVPGLTDDMKSSVLLDFDYWFKSLIKYTAQFSSMMPNYFEYIAQPEKRRVLLQGVANGNFIFRPLDFRKAVAYRYMNYDANTFAGKNVLAHFSNTLEFVIKNKGLD